MPGPSRSVSLASVASCVAALLACSASAPPVRSCATSEECPSTARCISSACVANAPPATAVTLPPAPLETNVLLSFDASATADPDAGDSVVSFAWAFRALSGQGCAAPAAASTGATATVRFGCPGRYAVDVTSTDEMGATSTATREFDVAAYSGPALVAVDADVAVDHVCTPAPRCTPTEPVTLSASATGIAPDQVSFVWTVVPPSDRPLTSSRRVSFSPSAAVASPSVAIETDGDAISGDWIFHVEVTDAAGPIGTAATRVTIQNRPPVVTETIPVPNHAFDGSQFTASGEIPFAVSDPDGDTLVDAAVQWHHTGDGASAFTGTVLGAPARVTFSIAVPYTGPADASKLIGGAGLERTIVFGISDANGAQAVAEWPIVVGNRPPVLVSEPAPFSIDHSYDPVGLAYVADVALSTWSDPDGDPLVQVPGSDTGDPDCPELYVQSAARARCRLPFIGTPAVANFAGTHAVTQAIQDPWNPAPTTSTVTFTIGNRAPSITSSDPHLVASACSPLTCCRFVPGEGCMEWKGDLPAVSTNVPSRWSDLDGDPLDVQIGESGVVCVGATCTVPLGLPPMAGVCGVVTQNLAMSVSDGGTTTPGLLPLSRECTPP